MTMNNDLVLTINNLRLNAQRVFDFLDVTESTRIDYKYRIGLFLDFLQVNGFTHNTFLEFKRYLTGRTDLSTSTKNKYLAAARIFLKELNRQEVLPVDITQNIKTFTQEKKHKRTGLNEDEMTKLVNYLRSLDPSPQNTRIRAIISLLALQGLRQVEIVRLDVEDLDLSNMTAQIQGKGRDDKEPIDLHPESVKVLADYIKSNRKASGALFTSISNNRHNQRLTTRAIREIVTSVLKGLSIEKSTHGFRHYFTTKLIKTYKGDLLEVAQYTRHRSLEMLQVYNDSIKKQADLPRYYNAFDGVAFSESQSEVPIIINTGS